MAKERELWNRWLIPRGRYLLKNLPVVHLVKVFDVLNGEIIWNAKLKQQGNFIDAFLARHVSGTYAHHQEH